MYIEAISSYLVVQPEIHSQARWITLECKWEKLTVKRAIVWFAPSPYPPGHDALKISHTGEQSAGYVPKVAPGEEWGNWATHKQQTILVLFCFNPNLHSPVEVS